MKGIIFTEDLFYKVIAGKKTETRRAIKEDAKHLGKIEKEGFGIANIFPPKYKPGEVVYIQEPFHHWEREDILFYAYGMDESDRKKTKWENKMFMPASAARYFIRITSVEVERLQDIENDGIRREGVEIPHQNDLNTLLACWILLWDSINKPPYAWDDNPWVWVYKFELFNQ